MQGRGGHWTAFPYDNGDGLFLMRILVTGISGFAGSHLTELLVAEGTGELFGTCRRGWPSDCRQLSGRVQLRSCDLCEPAQARELIREVQPEQIYHLAGYANAGKSFQEPDVVWAVNLNATRNLYDAIQEWGGRPRVLYVSSSQVYGDPMAPNQAHDEHAVLRPANPYATSKAAADLTSYQYTRSAKMDIVRVRPFNHIGPRQSPDFAVAHFAQQVAAIESGHQAPVLETGNLRPQRDLTDVRDMVRAYRLLMELGQTGEVYNAGTGVAHSMHSVLDRLLGQARLKIEIRQQPGLVRATETNILRADASLLWRQTGWRPHIPLEQTLMDTLEYWRESEKRR
jgi:GDP-4-dehydro-6-deoxy-D-mannose reductase